MRHEFVIGEPELANVSGVHGGTAAKELPELSNAEQDVCAVRHEIGHIATDRQLLAMRQEK